MKHSVWLAFLFLLFPVAERHEAALSFFTNVRDVSIMQPDKQNYFVVDTEIWTHSRADLGDLRLYDGDSSVQYSLAEQRAEMSSEEVSARTLNLGSVSGHTEFDIDMGTLAEYDRVRLHLDAKDFVVTASVAGTNSLGQPSSTVLTPSTLYDFSSEHLGSNFVLKLPPSSFRYLHVKLSSGIRPQQVKGVMIYNLREQQAAWSKVGSCRGTLQQSRTTIIVCDVPAKVPLNRIQFQIAPSQINFVRAVRVDDAKGVEIGRGEISRVRVIRAGTLVTDEDIAINVFNLSGQITLTIENGDNPSLAILGVQPLSQERRVYFDPQGKPILKLYYGDDKLATPGYDYAHFFHLDAAPAEAQLGADQHNPRYTGRPDERPWSERHQWISWVVMIMAVLGLTLLAIRGLRAGTRQ